MLTHDSHMTPFGIYIGYYINCQHPPVAIYELYWGKHAGGIRTLTLWVRFLTNLSTRPRWAKYSGHKLIDLSRFPAGYPTLLVVSPIYDGWLGSSVSTKSLHIRAKLFRVHNLLVVAMAVKFSFYISWQNRENSNDSKSFRHGHIFIILNL